MHNYYNASGSIEVELAVPLTVEVSWFVDPTSGDLGFDIEKVENCHVPEELYDTILTACEDEIMRECQKDYKANYAAFCVAKEDEANRSAGDYEEIKNGRFL